VHLGRGEHGPVTLRLFRASGSRVLISGSVTPGRLLALRAASMGAAARVVSTRDWIWTSVLGHCADLAVVAPGTGPQFPAGPTVIVDDRPTERQQSAGGGEVAPWHCRLLVRNVNSANDLPLLMQGDIAVLGAMGAQLALSVTSLIGVAAANATHLTTLPPHVVALVRRGHIQYVTLDPTPDEQRLLSQA
jgi:hypothetical protein